jgi:hypothetical protein
MRMNCSGSHDQRKKSSSRSGIACANPKTRAPIMSWTGRQFARISAASAMKPSPCV